MPRPYVKAHPDTEDVITIGARQHLKGEHSPGSCAPPQRFAMPRPRSFASTDRRSARSSSPPPTANTPTVAYVHEIRPPMISPCRFLSLDQPSGKEIDIDELSPLMTTPRYCRK